MKRRDKSSDLETVRWKSYTQARDCFLPNVNFISHDTCYQLLVISLVTKIKNWIKRNNRQLIEVSVIVQCISEVYHTCIHDKRRNTDIVVKDKKLTTPAYVTGHADSVRNEKLTHLDCRRTRQERQSRAATPKIPAPVCTSPLHRHHRRRRR